jgi:hypothetical protein
VELFKKEEKKCDVELFKKEEKKCEFFMPSWVWTRNPNPDPFQTQFEFRSKIRNKAVSISLPFLVVNSKKKFTRHRLTYPPHEAHSIMAAS